MRYIHNDCLDYELNISQDLEIVGHIYLEFEWFKIYGYYSLANFHKVSTPDSEPINLMGCVTDDRDRERVNRLRENIEMAYHRMWYGTNVDIVIVTTELYRKMTDDVKPLIECRNTIEAMFSLAARKSYCLWCRGCDIFFPKQFNLERHLQVRKDDYIFNDEEDWLEDYERLINNKESK